jgi:hypothetical protein
MPTGAGYVGVKISGVDRPRSDRDHDPALGADRLGRVDERDGPGGIGGGVGADDLLHGNEPIEDGARRPSRRAAPS